MKLVGIHIFNLSSHLS